MKGRFAALALAGILVASAAIAAPRGFISPGKKDKCPVCGMFVAKYLGWLGEVVFSDGGYAVFDGPKDLFRYYFDMRHYAAARKRDQVRAIIVTDYYSQELIDGAAAVYVLGSDIYGPMGKELIPFQSQDDAKGFLADHKGKRILGFKEIESALQELGD